MPNHHGDFIWFELLTDDAAAAADFYGQVIGWTVTDSGMPGMDYRILQASDAAIGGLMKLPEGGGGPTWLGYVGVDDVDRSVERMTAAGASLSMPAMTVEGVGRMAMLADPQGASFYLMRGESDEPSTSFAYDHPRLGHVAWAELAATDPDAARAFYGEAFGWTKDGEMEMGSLGKYEFLRSASGVFGALMPSFPQQPAAAWNFYFRVPDIDAAARHIAEHGGTVVQEPTEIPGGDFSLNATDPQGAGFGLVGERKQEESI